MKGINIKGFATVMILSLTLVTILSWMLSQYTNIPVLRSGGLFVMLMVVTFLVYIFVMVSDKKIDRGEIFTMFMIAISLLVSGIMLKRFLPEIFSALPIPTQEFFSAFPQTTKELFSVFG